MIKIKSIFALSIIVILCSCCNILDKSSQVFEATLQKHIVAIANRDIDSLKGTLSPNGKMQLIIPNSEIINEVDSFVEMHKEWFQDTTWTYEFKIIDTIIGEKVGSAIADIMYKEPDRNGKPYYNHMIVSYVLEKIDDQWYVVSDHASSISKSTD